MKLLLLLFLLTRFGARSFPDDGAKICCTNFGSVIWKVSGAKPNQQKQQQQIHHYHHRLILVLDYLYLNFYTNQRYGFSLLHIEDAATVPTFHTVCFNFQLFSFP